MAENINIEETQNVEKKKFKLGDLVVPGIIVIIIIGFLGVAYYNKYIMPRQSIDKEVSYTPEDYIKIGQYTGFEYEITQDMFDEYLSEYNTYYETVRRACKERDQVDFNYTGKIDGKKDANISEKDAVITIGEDEGDVYEKFSDAMIGKKAGESVEITITGEEATFLSESGVEYTDDVTMVLKVTAVSEEIVEEMTDKWVKENLLEDYGFETLQDVYDSTELELKEEAEVALWEMAVEKAVMTGYPDDLYEDIVVEFTQNANANAEYFGMDTEDYLYGVEGYTEETLEEAYLYDVKSELLMWALVKELLLDTTNAEVEAQYEEYAYELGYETVDEMKEVYTAAEMRESALLDKVHEYIYENSNVKISYKVPEISGK